MHSSRNISHSGTLAILVSELGAVARGGGIICTTMFKVSLMLGVHTYFPFVSDLLQIIHYFFSFLVACPSIPISPLMSKNKPFTLRCSCAKRLVRLTTLSSNNLNFLITRLLQFHS